MRHRDNRDAINFANEPVGKLFRQMLLPTVLGMLSIVILNFTDGAFIGHGAGADSLAAINIASPIFNILSGIGIMFGIGCSVVSSIHLSKGNTKAASLNLTQAIIGSSALDGSPRFAMVTSLVGTVLNIFLDGRTDFSVLFSLTSGFFK